MIRLWFCLALAFSALPSHAESSKDPLTWLSRVASAGQRLNYVGTFTYQNGQHLETSRITHLRDASGEYERMETLDGSPREVVRANGEVRCILPEQKTVIVDQAGGARAFPSRLALAGQNLSESYRIDLGGKDRVAGLEAQEIILSPRDDLRYGHTFWVDINSGLLLRSRMVGDGGALIEQFAFNDVRIGGTVAPADVKSHYIAKPDWHVINTRSSEVRMDQLPWVSRAMLPGFMLNSAMRRSLSKEHSDALQFVFSDGLASVSVFVEPLHKGSQPVDLGAARSGAISIYKRVLGNYVVTALGEVPARTVERLAEGIEPRKE